MSETAAKASPPVPPKLVVSRPSDEVANKSGSGRKSVGSRRRTAGPRPVSQEEARSPEWIDVDDSPPPPSRRRKASHRHHERTSRAQRPIETTQASETDLGRFFPRLSRILEASESTVSSRPSTRSSENRRHRDRSPTRVSRHRDDAASIHRRPVRRHRTGGVSRRNEDLTRVNPSLLSVLSGLTSTSDRSSGSNSTITQRSFDRRGSDSSKTPTGRPRYASSEVSSAMSASSTSTKPNVFDYIVASTVSDASERHSVMSSSSSHYEPSIAGSSEAPDTPSSRSTFPSPTSTRSQSVAELRRKYDPQYGGSEVSLRSNSRSPESVPRSLRKQPSVSDVAEDDEQRPIEPTAPSEVSFNPRQRSSSRSSRTSQRSASHYRQQEDALRQHMVYAHPAQAGHYVEPMSHQHRSPSTSSAQSDSYAYHMAMQQYQWPTPPAMPMHPATLNGHLAQSDRPFAPDPPDLSKRTLAGYEMLAHELSAGDSPVKPLYRKFEFLNHRILLHLQDELCELEEQLRTLDEIIAQMDPALSEGQRTPLSRRGEVHSGSEIHYQRTILLGRIFNKTEQYNRAMTAYNSMAKSSVQADADQVEVYQHWMEKHAPLHEAETRFLKRREDLVAPGKAEGTADRPTKQAALRCLPVALMLPLLLFSIIPTLGGRLAVTALIAVGAFIVAATTRIRHLMPPSEWAVCGAAYVLLMSAIAGCIPQHAS